MLEPFEIERIDRSKLYSIYNEWPISCRDANEIEVNIPDIQNVDEIIYAGMGGSATAGDILKDWLQYKIDKPFYVVKDYSLPKFTDKDTFVILASCSGNTEEIISILNKAIDSKCKIATISSGGVLEKISNKQKIPYTKIKSKLLSRASFPFLFVVSLKILIKSGIINDENNIIKCINVLDEISKKISSSISLEDNQSKQIATRIYDHLPIIYASNLFRGVAIRFKNVLNENAKLHAIIDTVPELCHNEIVAWEGVKDGTMRPIFLRYKKEGVKINNRFEIIKEIIDKSGFEIYEIWSERENHLSSIISMLYILDYASLYTSILRGFDPTPTNNIEIIKKRLI